MNVFLLNCYEPYLGHNLLGVYATEEAANAAMTVAIEEEQCPDYYTYDVVEVEVEGV